MAEKSGLAAAEERDPRGRDRRFSATSRTCGSPVSLLARVVFRPRKQHVYVKDHVARSDHSSGIPGSSATITASNVEP